MGEKRRHFSAAFKLEASLATEALVQAVWSRKPAPGLLYHSDRGVQYASAEYQARLHQYGIRCSMSHKGNCWDTHYRFQEIRSSI